MKSNAIEDSTNSFEQCRGAYRKIKKIHACFVKFRKKNTSNTRFSQYSLHKNRNRMKIRTCMRHRIQTLSNQTSQSRKKILHFAPMIYKNFTKSKNWLARLRPLENSAFEISQTWAGNESVRPKRTRKVDKTAGKGSRYKYFLRFSVASGILYRLLCKVHAAACNVNHKIEPVKKPLKNLGIFCFCFGGYPDLNLRSSSIGIPLDIHHLEQILKRNFTMKLLILFQNY